MPKNNSKPMRERRRDEAMKRDYEHSRLTLAQKIKKAQSRPGHSTRELARLNSLEQ